MTCLKHRVGLSSASAPRRDHGLQVCRGELSLPRKLVSTHAFSRGAHQARMHLSSSNLFIRGQFKNRVTRHATAPGPYDGGRMAPDAAWRSMLTHRWNGPAPSSRTHPPPHSTHSHTPHAANKAANQRLFERYDRNRRARGGQLLDEVQPVSVWTPGAGLLGLLPPLEQQPPGTLSEQLAAPLVDKHQ